MKFVFDVWKSFLALPTWVKIWVFLILVPVNIASIGFIGNPGASLVVGFAMAGLLFNAIPIGFDRGFTDAMAVPHVVCWVPLIFVITYYLAVSETVLIDHYRYFLISLMVCNLISLAFDIPDAYKWLRVRKG